MQLHTALLKIKNKKINRKDLTIAILVFIILAINLFGWFYFRTKQNPIQLNITPLKKNHEYLYSIYEPGVLSRPLGVAISQWGDVYVADSANHRLVVFDANGSLKETLGKAGEKAGEFNYPTSVAIKGKRIYVADFYNQRVQVLDTKGNQLSSLPRGEDLREIGSKIMPVALAIDKMGNLYVSDVSKQQILVFDDNGRFIRAFGKGGSNPGELSYVNGLAVNYDDKEIYLANSNNSRIEVFNLEGRYLGERAGGKLLTNPKGIAYEESSGFLYVADTLAHKIYAFDKEGNLVETIGQRGLEANQFNFPTAVAVDNKGRLFVADRENDRVQVYEN